MKVTRRILNPLLLSAAVLAMSSLASQAAVDTAFDGIVTDITTYFGTIKTLVVTVVVFGICVSYAKLIKKK